MIIGANNNKIGNSLNSSKKILESIYKQIKLKFKINLVKKSKFYYIFNKFKFIKRKKQ